MKDILVFHEQFQATSSLLQMTVCEISFVEIRAYSLVRRTLARRPFNSCVGNFREMATSSSVLRRGYGSVSRRRSVSAERTRQGPLWPSPTLLSAPPTFRAGGKGRGKKIYPPMAAAVGRGGGLSPSQGQSVLCRLTASPPRPQHRDRGAGDWRQECMA